MSDSDHQIRRSIFGKLEQRIDLADTANLFLVHAKGDQVGMMMPSRPLTQREALNLASWIVALVDPFQKDFQPLLNAVLMS